MVSRESDVSPRDFLRGLLRHKGKLLLWSAAVMGATLAINVTTSPSYRSESKLLVRLGRENVALDPTATIGQGPIMAVPHTREDDINSVVEILQSRVLLERVADSLGPETILEFNEAGEQGSRGAGESAEAGEQVASNLRTQASELKPQDSGLGTQSARLAPSTGLAALWDQLSPFQKVALREQAIAELEDCLEVHAGEKSNIISIRYDAAAPQLAQAVLTTLVKFYLEHHGQLHRTPGAREFFRTQAEELRSQLAAAEDELCQVKNRCGLTSIDEQRQILVQRIGTLQDALLANQSETAALDAQAAALKNQLAQQPAMIETQFVQGNLSAGADAMRQQLYALQLREQELLTKYTDEHFFVKEIRDQVKSAQEILAKEKPDRTETTKGINRAYEEATLALQDAQTMLAGLRSRQGVLNDQLASSRADLETLNGNEVRIVRLERDLELKDAAYRKYRENLEQGRIDEALRTEQISNISVVQPATLEERPVHPRKLVNLILGLLVAAFGSIGIAMLAERFDTSLRTVDEVEECLGLPALASIPRLQPRWVNLNGTGRIQ